MYVQKLIRYRTGCPGHNLVLRTLGTYSTYDPRFVVRTLTYLQGVVTSNIPYEYQYERASQHEPCYPHLSALVNGLYRSTGGCGF
eukprot:scaffold306025_cov19-Prasinocladus_malaysianus.AAC.1